MPLLFDISWFILFVIDISVFYTECFLKFAQFAKLFAFMERVKCADNISSRNFTVISLSFFFGFFNFSFIDISKFYY